MNYGKSCDVDTEVDINEDEKEANQHLMEPSASPVLHFPFSLPSFRQLTPCFSSLITPSSLFQFFSWNLGIHISAP